MKNKNWQTFVLTLLIVSALIGLFYLPRLTVCGTDLRRVNILSDVQRRDAQGRILAEVVADSLDGIVEQRLDSSAVEVKQLAYEDSIPEGMVAIEDYADVEGLHREMDRFYAALDESRTRPVRIAYFGDSYIEGDILTDKLRQLLQERYGGSGVGYVPMTSDSPGFRRSVRQRFQ